LLLDHFPGQRSPPVNIDNHPESVVRVEATNVHALFNFLLNSKTTITTTGAHAGIPPTLVAPVAFEGGTLKALKVRTLPTAKDLTLINCSPGSCQWVAKLGRTLGMRLNKLG